MISDMDIQSHRKGLKIRFIRQECLYKINPFYNDIMKDKKVLNHLKKKYNITYN